VITHLGEFAKGVAESKIIRPLVFDFACTTADLAEASASSAAFFAITYWIISNEYFASAMTWKARDRSLAVTSGTHFF
jgi:hypothetical protein